MSGSVVRVPGKVMLSGEYAVLHGGKAALAPVDRYLTLYEGQGTSTTPVVAEALAQAVDEITAYEADHPLESVAVERAEFVAEGPNGSQGKLGLGSSAAEAVGVVALRYERAGLHWTERRYHVARYADEAHRRAQGGQGSGADVWACALGQPIQYRLGFSGPEVDLVVPVEPAPRLTLAWTGVPADTRQLVAQFESWLDGDPLADGQLARLVDAADALAPLWMTAPEIELFDAFDEFVARMSECAKEAKLPWRVEVHEELEEWARDHGGRAKPTGAGGGDLVLLVGELPFEELTDVPLLHLAATGDDR